MSELPQVGQTYKHKTYGPIVAEVITKRGRGYTIRWHTLSGDIGGDMRLKDWQKATQ